MSEELEINLTTIETFLTALRPEGRQNLVAIKPTAGKALIVGKTFDLPGELEEASEWAADRNDEEYGVYFSVNEVKRKINKKPGKNDFTAGDYAHIDIDPDCSNGYAAGRQALLDRAAANEFDAAFVVDSGNGLGVFYKLPEPLAQGPLEEINKGLSQRLGGDSCHNIDRIMRLPGTINYSNKKKIDKGYPAQTQARVLDSDPERMLTPALVERAQEAPTEAPKPDADVDGVFLHALDDAELVAVAARLSDILGNDPGLRDRWHGNTAGLTDDSRSGYDMSIVRALASAGFTASEALASMLSASAGDGVVTPFKHNNSAMADKCDDERYFRRMWARTHANTEDEDGPAGAFSFTTASTQINMARLLGPQEYPPELVPGFLPREVATLVGAGGASKTTLSMVFSVRMAVGRPLWKGGDSGTPHGVLYLSGEDGDKVLYSRLQRIIKAEGLDDNEQALLAQNFHLFDATAHTIRFVESERSGINDTRHVQEFIAAFKGKDIQMVYIDTASLFGAGEDSSVNDAPVALIRACRKISHGLHDKGACVCVLHHMGQEAARAGTDDNYAGRGGSAGADNSRAVHVLNRYHRPGNGIGDGKYPMPTEIDRDHPGAVESGRVSQLKIAKYSYGPCPQQPFWVVRGEGVEAFQFSVYEPLCPEAAEANKATKQAQRREEAEKKAQVLEEKKHLILLRAINALPEAQQDMGGVSRAAVLRDADAKEAWKILTNKDGFDNAPRATITAMISEGLVIATEEGKARSKIWITQKGKKAMATHLKKHGLFALDGEGKTNEPNELE